MKSFLFSISILMGSFSFAQTNDTLSFMAIAPYFSNNTSRVPYEAKLSSRFRLYSDPPVNSEEEYKVGEIDIGGYISMKKDRYTIFHVGYGLNKYSFIQEYADGGYWNNFEDKEEVIGGWVNVQLGIGKAYYIGNKRKLMVMPEMLVGCRWMVYSGEVDLWLTRYHYGGAEIRVGGLVNMNVNYRLTKHVGLGLSFYNLLTLEKLFIEKSEDYEETVKERKNEFTIGQLTIPRLSLVCYLR